MGLAGVRWGEATIGILLSPDSQTFMTPNLGWDHTGKKWEFTPESGYDIEPVNGLEWPGGLGECGEGPQQILQREALDEARILLLSDQITVPDQSVFPVIQERLGEIWAIVARAAIVRLSESQMHKILAEGFVPVYKSDKPNMRLRDRCVWERVGALVI